MMRVNGSVLLQLKAEVGTKAACNWLKHAAGARLLHVFDNVINLADIRGRVLSIVSHRDNLGPFSVLVQKDSLQSFRNLVGNGEPVVISSILRIGSMAVDWKSMDVWEPAPPWEDLREHRRSFKASSALTADKLSLLKKCRNGSAVPAGTCSQLPGAGEAGGQEKVRDLLYGSEGSRNVIILRLLGAGQGLTPSGDDYLMGVLLAAHIFLPQERLRCVTRSVLEKLPGRTTLLSTAWLRAAAAGECSMLWHRMFNAVLNENEKRVGEALEAIAARGYTSGVEALSGFLGAVTAAC